jgi:hypothetical protein
MISIGTWLDSLDFQASAAGNHALLIMLLEGQK